MTTLLADSITQPVNLEFDPGAGTGGWVNITGANGVTFHDFKVKSINYAWTDTSVDITSNDTQYYLQNVQMNVVNNIVTDAATPTFGIYHPSHRTTNATVSTGGNITIDLESTNYIHWGEYGIVQQYPVLSPAEQLKQIMQERQSPRIITSKSLSRTSDIREVRARETLRRVLGAKNFGTFMTRGFVSIKAKSGLMYQIFPGHGITNVYNKGRKIETLCVVLTRNFAATDSLIMRYLLILNNEERFRSLAVRHVVRIDGGGITFSNSGVYCVRQEDKSLAQIYKEIKAMAA